MEMIDPRRITVIDDQGAAIIRGMTGAERLRLASDLTTKVRARKQAAIRLVYHEWTSDEVMAEVNRAAANDELLVWWSDVRDRSGDWTNSFRLA